jgi:hypothetical protein
MVDELLSGWLDATMANARGKNFGPPMSATALVRNEVAAPTA